MLHRPWFVHTPGLVKVCDLFWWCSASVAWLLLAERVVRRGDLVTGVHTLIVSCLSPRREPEATLISSGF